MSTCSDWKVARRGEVGGERGILNRLLSTIEDFLDLNRSSSKRKGSIELRLTLASVAYEKGTYVAMMSEAMKVDLKVVDHQQEDVTSSYTCFVFGMGWVGAG